MPTLQDSLSVAANATSENVLAQQLYRFVPSGTRVTLSVSGSAVGLRCTMLNGVPVVDDQAVNITNRFPVIPDDVMTGFSAPGGELILRFRNTTAGALTIFWRVDLN